MTAPLITIPLDHGSGVVQTFTVTEQSTPAYGYAVRIDGRQAHRADGSPAVYTEASEAVACALNSTGWLHSVAFQLDTADHAFSVTRPS